MKILKKSKYIVIFFILFAIIVKGQPLPSFAQSDDFKVGKLKNGFTYYLKVIPSKTTLVEFIVKVGHNNELSGEEGFAHVTEHIAVNGTKSFRDGQKFLQDKGIRRGTDMIATTGGEYTRYLVNIPVADMDTLLLSSLKFYSEVAQQADFSEERIEVERAAVLAEGGLGTYSNPNVGLRDKIGSILASGDSREASPNKYKTAQNVRNFKSPTLKAFYSKWYRPDNQCITVVGSFDLKNVERTIVESFSTLTLPSTQLLDSNNHGHFKLLKSGINFNVINHSGVIQPRIEIFFKKPTLIVKTVDDLKQIIYSKLFNLMVDERFGVTSYQLNTDLELTPPRFDRSGIYGLPIDVLHTVSSFKKSPASDAFNQMLIEMEKIRRFGFYEEDLIKAKVKITQDPGLFGAYEKDRISGKLRENFLYGHKIVEDSLVRELIKSTSLTSVNKAVRDWLSSKDNVNIILILPLDAKSDLTQVLADQIILKLPLIKVIPLTKAIDYSSLPLMSVARIKKLRSGPVTNINSDKATGITSFHLANGIQVFFKKTKVVNSNDQASLKYINYTDILKESSLNRLLQRFGPGIAINSGLGNFDSNGLEQFLKSNNIFQINPSAEEDGFSIGAQFEGKSLEKSLQILHMFITNPKVNTTQIQKIITMIKANMTRKRALSELLIDTIDVLTRGRHEIGHISISELRPTTIVQFVKNHFSATSGTKLFIAGDFEERQIIDLTSKYLGSLPESKTQNPKTQPVLFKKSNQRVHNVSMQNSDVKMSEVRMVVSSSSAFSLINKFLMEIVKYDLRNKLLDRLRGNEKGVYFVEVGADIEQSYLPQYRFEIYFECLPKDVNRMINSTESELVKFLNTKIDPTILDSLKRRVRDEITDNLSKPHYWVNYLCAQVKFDRPKNEVIMALDLLDNITSSDIQKFVNHHFDLTKISKYVLTSSKMKSE